MTTLQFPPDFLFGSATAAFQIEGGGDADGRGPSIWDAFCEVPGRISDGSNGMVACDHYHRMPQDVALMRELNLDAYRFSTSWARVCPDGRTLNPAGLDFYSRLVDELLAAGIKPWLTLYHWDLPQALGERGGWTNRDTSYLFAEYTRHMVDALGDRVQVWTTLNEPWCSSFLSYAGGDHAPGHTSPREAVAAAHHLLLAHGLGVQVLREAEQNLTVGITCNTTYSHPADPDNPGDVDAARRIDGGFNRIFLDPIFKGEYPADVIEDMAEAGLGSDVRDGDMELISAPIDVLGVNFYNGAAHAAPLPGAKPEIRITEGGIRLPPQWSVRRRCGLSPVTCPSPPWGGRSRRMICAFCWSGCNGTTPVRRASRWSSPRTVPHTMTFPTRQATSMTPRTAWSTSGITSRRCTRR